MSSISANAVNDIEEHYFFDEYEGAPSSMPPSSLREKYDELEDLKKAINEFFKNHGYAINIRGFAKNSKNIKNIVYFCCSRDQTMRSSKDSERRQVGFKRTKCSFQAMSKLINNKWTLIRINHEDHNHEEDEEFSHATLRRYKKTSKIRVFIRTQTQKNNAFKNILDLLKREFDIDDFNKSVFKFSDVWNELDIMREKKLKNMTFIQVLNVQLQNSFEYWTRVMLNSMISKMEFLFWINNIFMIMLKINDEICILDCIYKTNRHNMSLTIFIEVIELNISFHSKMCFMKKKTAKNYERLFDFINELYQHVDISLSVVWLIDDDAQIAIDFKAVIFDASHVLCIWHIEQNVTINCKKHFSTNEIWCEFFDSKQDEKKDHTIEDFQDLIHVFNENEFDRRWQALQNKYNLINDEICIYLINEIIFKKKQWSKIWTNQKMHFNNHISFKSEDDHAQLKIELKTFIENFMTVIEKVDRRCDRIKRDYINKVKNFKQRLNHKLRKSLYRDLMIYVISYALRSIDFHYTRLIETQKKKINLSSCTRSFRRIMSFSCAHDIERTFVDTIDEEVLKLKNIHSHWRYRKFNNRHYMTFNIFVELSNDEASSSTNSILQIQNSRKVKIKKRSVEAFNKIRDEAREGAQGRDRQAEHQRRFTQRDSSDFEYATTIDLTSKIQMSSSQSSSNHYTMMSSFSSQFYSRFITQFVNEFTDSTMISTTSSTIDQKRRNNTNITNNIKRIKKTD